MQAVWERMAGGEMPSGIIDKGTLYFVIGGNACTRAVNTLKRRNLIYWEVTGGFYDVRLTDAGCLEMARFKRMREFAANQRKAHEKAMR